MEKGIVVKALAGKEKNQVFVVIDVTEKFVYLADGKRLKKDKPKKKSVKHVQIVSTKKFPVGDLNIKNDKVNASIRNFIKNL